MASEFQSRLLLLLFCITSLPLGSCDTNPEDASALRSLVDQWENLPPSWKSGDPCDTQWEGIQCKNSRVTSLKLSTMGLEGSLSGDLAQLSELGFLDLSYNGKLKGSLFPNIAKLKKLTTLILAGCSFSGTLPSELGNLPQLSYLALNSNKFSGQIPASLGRLSNLYWFDLADNQFTGPLPTNPGLNQLLNTKHFHFFKNQLSGSIPEDLFSHDMTLLHLLLDGNNFSGRIPASLGLVQSLEVLRLDRNSLTGPVPSNISNLLRVSDFNLANNKLTGPLPDLTGMNALKHVDLSNNTFNPSETPSWFSSIQSLTVLVIESGEIHGEMPQKLFSLPQLQQVILNNNSFNGTLDLGNSIGPKLQLLNFENNELTSVKLDSNYNITLILVGNPVCRAELSSTNYCRLQQRQSTPYTTSLTHCGDASCATMGQSLNPQSRSCSYPYEGLMIFRAPSFRDITNRPLFESLEKSLWTKLNLAPGSVFLQNPFFSNESDLQLHLKLFPLTGLYFNRSEILRIGYKLSCQEYVLPLGPFYFIGCPYPFPDDGGQYSSSMMGVIIGMAIGCILLVLVLLGVVIYAVRQYRAQRATELSWPFASWASGGPPQLKGARWFSYDELKKITNNFSETNEIGFGGYGKVYKGMLPSGQLVAIKRAQQGSIQGGLEFKTEIELLSRVHHKNLVGLIGFCFEQGEQMLVYEFIPNGTLRERLSGKSGILLGWKRRLRIALSSARGLAYLHELANPPIIHRDVKSTNILLDENLNAKVADFGLSKLLSDSKKGHVSTQVKGTPGYVDPEYFMTQQLTEKSDVYSFGVVMLELVTARPAIERGKYIVREVKVVMDRKDGDYYGMKEIMDPVIRNSAYLAGFPRFVDLALQCVEESAADRPTMSDIVKEIEMILHNDGLNTNSNSASSSATEFANTKGGVPHRHPYDDSLTRKDESSGDFEYSGGYSIPKKIEPK